MTLDLKTAERLAREMSGSPLPGEIQSIVVEDFLYEELIKIFTKKNQPKYNGYWLLIYFNSSSFLHDLITRDKREYVFNRIISEDKELVLSLEKNFKKIIFLPLCDKTDSFEWDKINVRFR